MTISQVMVCAKEELGEVKLLNGLRRVERRLPQLSHQIYGTADLAGPGVELALAGRQYAHQALPLLHSSLTPFAAHLVKVILGAFPAFLNRSILRQKLSFGRQ